MKLKFLLFTVLIFIMLLGSCGIEVKVEDVKGERLEYLNSESDKDSILIIDVRSYDKYKSGHLAHAINIPIDEIQTRLDEINDWKNKPIYLYAENNDISFKAAEILVSNRFRKIYNADGLEQYDYKFINYNVVRGKILESMLDDTDAIILDCRDTISYNRGHIKGALSFPEASVTSNIKKLPDKNAKLLLYCNVGTSSARVAQELWRLGYTQIYHSVDGILEYPFKLVKEKIDKN